MRMSKVIHPVIVVLLLIFSASAAHAITRFGGNPFYKPPLTSVADLKNMLQEQRDDVREGMNKAGIGEVYESLMLQLPDIDVQTVEYGKGTSLEWMFYRKDGMGPVRIDKGVVWESDTPFTGFEFSVDHNGNRYTFVVPAACGNLALAGIGPVPPPMKPAEPVAAPVPAPAAEDTPPAPVAAAAEAAPPFAFVADAGYLYQADPAHYLLLRGGLEYYFDEHLSLLGMIGATPKLEGIDGHTAFIADVMLNYTWSSKVFAGIGVGAWLTGGDSDNDTEDNDLDLILDVGYQFYEKPDAYKISGFVELRSAVDEISDFDLYGRVGAGLRIHF